MGQMRRSCVKKKAQTMEYYGQRYGKRTTIQRKEGAPMNRISIHNRGNVKRHGAQHSVCNTCALPIRFQLCEILFEMRSHKPRDQLIGDSQSLTGKKRETPVWLKTKRKILPEANIAIIRPKHRPESFMDALALDTMNRPVVVHIRRTRVTRKADQGGPMEQIILLRRGFLILFLVVGWILIHWLEQIAPGLPFKDGGMMGAEIQMPGRT